MSKLILNVGDKVRNINEAHPYYQQIGEVINDRYNNAYGILWNNVAQEYYDTAFAYMFLEKIEESNPSSAKECDQTTKRKLIKRDRINVVNGKTQDEMVAVCGHARGVEQFNTRCLGRTTGQAFLAIGQAMCNPGTEIRIAGVDHAIGGNGVACKHTLDKHFSSVVGRLLGSLQGFSFTDTHLVYHPIQTVETYVEYKQ